MLRSRFVTLFSAWCLLFGASAAQAHDTDASVTLDLESPPPSVSYEEYRLGQLHYLAGRSRTGLIVGSSVTVVGAALVAPAFVNECVRIASSSSFDDLRCSTKGKALLGVGIPVLLGGVTTLLVTSVMFGVRRGRIRSIEDRIEYEKRRGLHFDPSRGAFAF